MVKNLTAALQTFYEPYTRHFEAMAAKFEKTGLSGPVLMSPEKTAYAFQKTRLLVVSSELRGWSLCGESVPVNMDNYTRRNALKNDRDFTFWETRALFEQILGNEPGSSAWTSLGKFSFAMSAYDAIYRNDIERFDELLMGELVRIKPDVAIFMTGLENDQRIGNTLEGMKMKKVKGFHYEELVTMHHMFLPRRSFRISHPVDFGEEGIDRRILGYIAACNF